MLAPLPKGIAEADLPIISNLPMVNIAMAAIAGFGCGWAMHGLMVLLQSQTSRKG